MKVTQYRCDICKQERGEQELYGWIFTAKKSEFNQQTVEEAARHICCSCLDAFCNLRREILQPGGRQ